MGSILLHNRGVQLYLLCVGALFITFLWDYFRRPRPPLSGRQPVREMRRPAGAALPFPLSR